MQAESKQVEHLAPVPQRMPWLGTRTASIMVPTLAALIVLSDQLTKAAITERFGPCGATGFTPVIGRFAGFSYVCNTGTAFSRFQNSSLVWIPVLIAAGVVIWLWYRSLQQPHLLQQIAFSMILGGAVGNMIDRWRLGYVVDFVDLRLNDTLRWYVFNVADSCISIGVVLLALVYWRIERDHHRHGATTERP